MGWYRRETLLQRIIRLAMDATAWAIGVGIWALMCMGLVWAFAELLVKSA